MFKNLTDKQLEETIAELEQDAFLLGRDYENENVLDLLLEVQRLRKQIKEQK